MKRKTVLITGACINTGVDIVNKFAENGYDIVFTGRSAEKVCASEKDYRESFPDANIKGFPIDSLNGKGEVDTEAVDNLFEELDRRNIFI